MLESPFDYIELRKTGNRSCSLLLVERLKEDVSSDELKNILSWMDEHDDFRVEEPLLKILEDGVTEFFLTSPDYLVRKISAQAFADWNDGKSLVRLLNDKAYCVRRYACYCAKHLTRDPEILEALSNILSDKRTDGSFAVETLASYVVHGATNEPLLLDTLEDLARNDNRQDVREEAICLLLERKPERISSLLNILQEPPMLTWSPHRRLLSFCSDPHAEVPVLDSLLKIDDFAVQQELAIIRAGMDSKC